MNNLFSRDLCAALVLSFGHFLWIGTLIAVVAAVAVRRQGTAEARYRVWLAALIAMALSPFVALAVLQSMPTAAPVAVESRPLVAGFQPAPRPEADQNLANAEQLTNPQSPENGAIPAGGLSSVATLPGEAEAVRKELARPATAPRESAWWRDYAPLVTSLYLIGVSLMGLRLALGLWGGRRLRNRATLITERSLLDALQRQADALGMKLVPALAYCERVAVPTVLGILKPMILLPVSLASGLAPDQIESVLAHELAHLRRYDHLVNLLQGVIESLHFFHPAVWWVSRRIRDEREHCCDDLVIACGAVPLDYAASLLRVAELSREAEQRGHNQRRSFTAVSLFATGDRPSTLRRRIARLLGYQTELNVRAVHPWVLFCLATCCVGAIWLLSSMTFVVLAEINRDRSQKTVIVAWSSIVDDSVMNEIRAINGLVTSETGSMQKPDDAKFSTLRCSADDLRAILKNHADNKRLVALQKTIRHSMPTGGWQIGAEKRFFQMIDSETILGTVVQNPPYHVNWHADGHETRDEDSDRARLNVDGKYRFTQQGEFPVLDPKDAKASAAAPKPFSGNAASETTVKFDSVMSDGEATVVVMSPPAVTRQYQEVVMDDKGQRFETKTKQAPQLHAIFVHEAVRVPVKQLDQFNKLTRVADWVRRGANDTREHTARLTEWQSRPSRVASAADPAWTRELPNGGHVQLVGLGRPNEAQMIWWTPEGEPLKNTHSNFDRPWLDKGTELAAIVRVWESNGSRSQLRPVSARSQFGITNVDDQFPTAPGSQLLLVPVLFDKSTGKVTLKIGAGSGTWTDQTPIQMDVDLHDSRETTATMIGIEFKANPSHEHDFVDHASRMKSPLNMTKRTSTGFFWTPTRDFEFTVDAETQDGRFVSTTTNPIVYVNETPNTRNAGVSFEHPLPKSDIKQFLIKSRPVHWTEFTDFAIEPAVALVPPLEFGKNQEKDVRPFSAKLPGGVTVNLVGVGMPPTQPPEWWQADGSRLAKRPNESLDGYHSNGFPNQADCREIALEILGLPQDHSVTARVGNNVAGVAFSNFQNGVKAYNVASGPFSGVEATSVQVSLRLEPLVPAQGIDAEGRKLAEVEVPLDLKPLYDRVQPIRVESRNDQQELWLKPLGDLLVNPDWRLFAIDTNGKQVRPSTTTTNGEGTTYGFKLARENLARFEYHLRPYRHSVTFENVSLHPGKKTEVKVTVTSAPKPQHYVANLPDGRSVEFVGITKNTALANEGWKPDGTPIGDVGYWPATTYISGNTIGSFTENGEHPEPNAGAIDFLFRFRGLKAQPSFSFELAANGGSYSHWPVKDPYELRVAAQRRVPSPPGSKWTIPDGEMRVGVTDEPWGRYVKISPEGKTLDPIRPDELHASTYGLIEVVGTRPHDRAPTGNTIVLRRPITDADSPANNEGSPDLLHRYAFEFRAIDTEGKNHWADSWLTSSIPNMKLKESQYGLMQPLPEGATLSHYEYRLRPYRHWVTFQSVSLEQGKTSDVRVKVESIASSPPDDARVESAPKPISFKEAKQLVEGLGGQCYGDNKSDEPDARVQLNGEKVDDATIRKLAGYPKLTSLWLYGMVSVTDDGLAALAHCTSLTNLQLQAPAVTDVGVRHLASLTKLGYLTLSNTKLTDEGLRHVATFPRLTFFSLHSDNVSDAGIQHLARMTSLNHLRSHCPKVSNDGLKMLAQSASLEFFQFSSEHVTDEGMTHLASLKTLNGLEASYVRLTDESLKAIGTCANLGFLSLSNTEITDAGLEHLKGLTKVDRLHFHGNRFITGEGLSHLRGLPLKQFTLMGPSTSDKSLELLAAFPQITHLAVGFGAQAPRKNEAYLLTDSGLKHLAALPALAYLTIDGAAITDAGVVVLKQASLENVLCLRCPQLTAGGKKAWQTAAPHVQITGDFTEPKPAKNDDGNQNVGATETKPIKAAPMETRPREETRAAKTLGDKKIAETAAAPMPTVIGTVVSPDGQPVAGIEVLAFQGEEQLEPKFKTDERGEIRVPKEWRESEHWLTLVAREGRERLGWFDFMIHGHSDIGQKAEDGSFKLVLLPMSRTVRGRVLDEAGQPLAQIPVRITQLDHEVNSMAVHWRYQKLGDEALVLGAVTDNEGRFELKLPADTFAWLGTSHPDWVDQRIRATKENDDVGDTKLVRAAKVAGRVIDSRTGKPLKGITISANALTAEIMESGGGEAISDADGMFLIHGLRGGEYTIQLEKSPFKTLTAPAFSQAMLKPGETFEADFSLSVGKRVAGRVLDMNSGEPIPECTVRCTDLARPANGLTAETNERGEFEFFVLAGKCSLDATEGHIFGAESTRELDVATDGQPEPVVLKVGPKQEPVGKIKIFMGLPLDRKVSLDFKAEPLEEALESLCNSAGMKLELDEAALTNAGYSNEAPINLVDEKPVTLKDGLTRILKPFEKLAFTIDKNTVLVSTREQVEAREKQLAAPKRPIEGRSQRENDAE